MLVTQLAVLCLMAVMAAAEVRNQTPPVARRRQNEDILARMRRLRMLRILRERTRPETNSIELPELSPSIEVLETGTDVETTSSPSAESPPLQVTSNVGPVPTSRLLVLPASSSVPTTSVISTVRVTSAGTITYTVLPPPVPRPVVPSTSNQTAAAPREGDVRVSGGRGEYDGNVEIFHRGSWGFICDDEWDMAEAEIVCRQLGYESAQKPTHDGFFGHPENVSFWMDNLYCTGAEQRLDHCRFDGWGEHDCVTTELAGVSCRGRRLEEVKATGEPEQPEPEEEKVPKTSLWLSTQGKMKMRLRGGRVPTEGRLEMKIGDAGWGVVCGDGWSMLQANVVCRSLGYGYASAALQTGYFGGNDTAKILSGVECIGNETSLIQCVHDEAIFCPGDPNNNIATVVCQEEMADLVPDHLIMMQTAYLEDRQMFYLQCAMEENCLTATAYQIRKDNPDWHLAPRRLLRFTTKVMNIGTDAFRPFLPKTSWEWHACHMHYHSMEVFSTYDLTDSAGRRVAQGHKASFCLEDSECSAGVEPSFSCANFGDQGISVGCADTYAHNIDCQWLDLSDIDPGNYQLRVIVNGEYKVGEQTWDNNAVVCHFEYTGTAGSVTNCRLTRP